MSIGIRCYGLTCMVMLNLGRDGGGPPVGQRERCALPEERNRRRPLLLDRDCGSIETQQDRERQVLPSGQRGRGVKVGGGGEPSLVNREMRGIPSFFCQKWMTMTMTKTTSTTVTMTMITTMPTTKPSTMTQHRFS